MKSTLLMANSLLLLTLLHAFARGAYYTCLYLWAAGAERANDPSTVMIPGPLAEALARR